MQKKTVLAAAVATTVGGASVGASAATYEATLTEVRTYSYGGTSGAQATVASSTATWSYDSVTNLVTQTSGLFNARLPMAPTPTLYRISATGLLIGNGAAASATTYVCTEGNFGGIVSASICGNYTFGANFANESTTSWGPGTAISRTIGGDDSVSGPQQSVADLDGMNTITWTGTSLVLRNATCTGICTTTAGGFNSGQQWTFAVVPAPAAVWLFGSALGMMGLMRRNAGA